MKPLKVRCHFCKDPVLDMTCDKVVVEKVVNTRPMIVKKKKVYRCQECKAKQKAEKKVYKVTVNGKS